MTEYPAQKVTLATVALMLAVVFLALFDAGFDNQAVHGVLFMLLAVSIYLAFRGELALHVSAGEPLFLKPFMWYFLFLLWAGVSIFWSIEPHRTLVEFLQVSLYGFAFLLTCTLDEKNLFRLGRILLVVAVLVGLFGLSQYLLLDTGRIRSTMANPNAFGIFIGMSFLLGWSYYLRKPRHILAFACVIILVVLILTRSRGAYISTGVALPLIVLLGFDIKEIKQAAIKTAICFGAAWLITQGLINLAPVLQGLGVADEGTTVGELISTRQEFVAWSGVSRVSFWETGARIFLSQPLSGTGLGTFFMAYFTDYADNIWYSRFVHNHYIQTMAELGVFGIVTLLGFLLATARLVWLKLKEKTYPLFFPGLLAAMVAFLIHIGGDFSWNFPGAAILFFICCGAVVSLAGSEQASLRGIKKAGLVLLALLIFALTAWQLSAQLVYRQAASYQQRGDAVGMAETYDMANSFYPINPSAFYDASYIYYLLAHDREDRDLLEESIERAERAVALSPADATLHTNLGKLYFELGLHHKAEEHLKKAVELASYRLTMYVELARFYMHRERYEDALEVVEEGLALKEHAAGKHPTEEDKKRAEESIRQLKMMQQAIEEE